jgi:hypothetical protein
VLFLSVSVGCGKKEAPQGSAPVASASAAAKASTSAVASAKPSGGVKGSSENGSDGAGGGGAGVAGDFVIKTHELPPATKLAGEFKPTTSGFKFQNYGNEDGVTNLTVTELRRMFGDQVCASVEAGKCTLTPVAAQWLEGSNKSMGGGHCEGFAALTLLMERGQIDPKLFGAATAPELELKGNEKLQREIAYWFVTQGVPPMAMAEDKTMSPAQVVEKLVASFKGDVTAETYTLGIYAPGYKMGHATTPYAVVDKGDDVVWIMHYDNNYPAQEKYIVVDKKANSWSYTTAADPAASEHAYKGDLDTKTLTLAPTSVRTGKLICHFCGTVGSDADADKGSKGAAGGGGAAAVRELSLEGDADLLITDEAGKRLGYADGKFVSEIAGASFAADKSGADEAEEDEPTYYLPTGKKLKVTLDGSSLKKASESDVHLFGRGYSLGVEGVALSPGQKDEIDFSADGSVITYTTKKAETPTLVVDIDTAAADYEFEVKVAGETAGQTVELSIDLKKGTFNVKVKGEGAAKPTLSVKLVRYGDKGAIQSFTHKGVAVGADQAVSFGYAAWKGDKSPLHVAVSDAKGAVVSEEDEADDE